MKLFLLLTATILALGAIEGAAYWWMHPAPAGQGQPVLVWKRGDRGQESGVGEKACSGGLRPSIATGKAEQSGQRSEVGEEACSGGLRPSIATGKAEESGRRTEVRSQEEATAQSSSPIQNSKFKIQHSTLTHLPDLYAKAAPMLRCTGGQVCFAQFDDSINLHLAFFEWDGTDTGSVLEAFRHLPEACMGSIGMTLVKIHPPRSYVVRERESGVGSQGSADRGQKTEDGQGSCSGGLRPSTATEEVDGSGQRSDDRGQRSEVRSQEEATAQSSSSADNRQPTTDNSSPSPSSSDHRSLITDHSLLFDHTEFRDTTGTLVHAFRAVWVSGSSDTYSRNGLGGDQIDRLRAIRLKSALTRYRPEHARVIQGAVRGAANGDAAWKVLKENMLIDLSME